MKSSERAVTPLPRYRVGFPVRSEASGILIEGIGKVVWPGSMRQCDAASDAARRRSEGDRVGIV